MFANGSLLIARCQYISFKQFMSARGERAGVERAAHSLSVSGRALSLSTVPNALPHLVLASTAPRLFFFFCLCHFPPSGFFKCEFWWIILVCD